MTPLILIAFILWIALTGSADLSLVILGVSVCIFLDWLFDFDLSWKDAGVSLLRVIPALFRAYVETFAIMTARKHRSGYSGSRMGKLSPWNIFMEVFLVTLTPKTVTVNVDHVNEMLVHRFEEDKK